MIEFATIFFFLCGSSLAAHDQCNPQVAIFDFSGVRGDPPPSASSLPAIPNTPNGVPCGEGREQIFCSDAAYPADITCNLGGLEGHDRWMGLGTVGGIKLKYSEGSEGSECTVWLDGRELSGGKRRFVFREARCFPGIDAQTLPPFRVAELTGIELLMVTSQCVASEAYLLGGAKEAVLAEGERAPVVRFSLKHYRCGEILIAAFSLSEGRPEDTSPTLFTHDGTRYRPVPDSD